MKPTIILSDASVKEEGSYAAWIVATPNSYGNGHFLYGHGKIFEDKADSHRAECFGILGGIYSLKGFTNKVDLLLTHPYEIVCDNSAAVNFVGNMTRYPQITSNFPDFDVLQTIRQKIQNDKFKFRHVKGHAERSPQPWDIYTTLNIEVDDRADRAMDLWESQVQQHESYDKLEGEEWQLYAMQRKIYKDLDITIRDHTSNPKIKETWSNNGRVQQEWFNEVNWRAMDKAMKASSNNTKHWIIKRSARDCGAHAVLMRRRERDNDQCPFCGLSESVEHVYQCQDERVKTVWEVQLQEFETFLLHSGTDPDIREQLIEGIITWRDSKDFSNKPMIWDQSQIGWRGIMEGIMGLHWMEQQQHYAMHNNNAMNASKWAHMTIRKLWIIAWELWRHRNAEAHRMDQEIMVAKFQDQINSEIEIGAQGYGDLERWFSPNEVEQARKGNLVYMSCWLNAVRARRDRHRRQEQTAHDFRQMRNTLRQFLSR